MRSQSHFFSGMHWFLQRDPTISSEYAVSARGQVCSLTCRDEFSQEISSHVSGTEHSEHAC